MKNPREARLKPEFAHLYPGLKPRTWYNAAWLSATSIAKMLNDSHFEFRGGRPRRDRASERRS